MRTVTLDDGTKVRSFGRDRLYLPDDGTPERFPGAYQHKRQRGIAWRIVGAEVEVFEAWDDDSPESAEPYCDWRETGRVVAIMVGDDLPESFERDELEPLGDLDYCAECGQVGCSHDGRDRSEA